MNNDESPGPNTALDEDSHDLVFASPSELPSDPNQPPIWWRPTWRDALGQLGYRWIFLLPVLALVGFALAAVFLPGVRDLALGLGFQLSFVVIGIVASLAAYGIKSAARARREPFCIHCGYNLTGLPDGHRCPECGRPFSLRVIAEYRRDPQWFIHRWEAMHKLPQADSPFDAGTVRRPKSRDGT